MGLNKMFSNTNLPDPTHSVCQQTNEQTLPNGPTWSGPKLSKIVQKDSKIVPKVQNGLKVSNMFKTIPKWLKKNQNYPKLSKDPKLSTMVYNGPIWPKMVHDGPEWFQTGPNTSKWSKKIQNGLIWSNMIKNHLKIHLNRSGRTRSPGLVCYAKPPKL